LKKHPELHPGQVFVSSAGKMSFQKVIHTVEPMWKDGQHNEDKELELAVEAALKKSNELGFSTVAISYGLFSFPIERAGTIMMRSILNNLKTSRTVKVVHFVSDVNFVRQFHDVLSGMTTVVSTGLASLSGL